MFEHVNVCVAITTRIGAFQGLPLPTSHVGACLGLPYPDHSYRMHASVSPILSQSALIQPVRLEAVNVCFFLNNSGGSLSGSGSSKASQVRACFGLLYPNHLCGKHVSVSPISNHSCGMLSGSAPSSATQVRACQASSRPLVWEAFGNKLFPNH